MNTIAHLDTSVLDTVAKFFRVMQKAGADFTGPMQSISKRRNLVSYLEMGCPKLGDNGELLTLPEGHELARLILGNDYITPEEVATAYDVGYTDEQFEHFADTLPDMDTILWLRINGYMLIAGPPKDMNLLEVRELNNQLFYSKMKGFYAKDNQSYEFATIQTDVVKAGEWLMINKGEYQNSFNKIWDEQKCLLAEIERIPNVSEVGYAVTAYYKIHKIYLLPFYRVRTSSVSKDGYHVEIGKLCGNGLEVGDYKDNLRYLYVGVSSARN